MRNSFGRKNQHRFPLLVRENHLELTELSSIKEFQFPHMVTLDQQGIGIGTDRAI